MTNVNTIDVFKESLDRDELVLVVLVLLVGVAGIDEVLLVGAAGIDEVVGVGIADVVVG